MRCPTLAELPPPPRGKTGWPWTEESAGHVREGKTWPRITIVTPSFNQGHFIEGTLRSVLLQGYPDLEYFVLDGGSTDNSAEIIEKYSPWLSYWVSERDSGQSDAINRGLKRATGSLAGWINSDDMLCRNALVAHANRIGFEPDTVYLGNCLYLDEDGNVLSRHRGQVRSLEDLVSVPTVWRAGGHIVQPEVLFPREMALKVGCLNVDNHCTMDFELWGRLFLAGAAFRYTDVDFGMFRRHAAQKTQDGLRQTRSLVDVASEFVRREDRFDDLTRKRLLEDLAAYDRTYQAEYWQTTGRLARMGLPRGLVQALRGATATLQKRVRSLFGHATRSF